MARELTRKYLLSLSDDAHDALKQLALDRSAQLGERVGMGFVVAELIELHKHMLATNKVPEVYGAHE